MRALFVSILLWQILARLVPFGSIAPSTTTVGTGQVKTMDETFPPPH